MRSATKFLWCWNLSPNWERAQSAGSPLLPFLTGSISFFSGGFLLMETSSLPIIIDFKRNIQRISMCTMKRKVPKVNALPDIGDHPANSPWQFIVQDAQIPLTMHLQEIRKPHVHLSGLSAADLLAATCAHFRKGHHVWRPPMVLYCSSLRDNQQNQDWDSIVLTKFVRAPSFGSRINPNLEEDMQGCRDSVWRARSRRNSISRNSLCTTMGCSVQSQSAL